MGRKVFGADPARDSAAGEYDDKVPVQSVVPHVRKTPKVRNTAKGLHP